MALPFPLRELYRGLGAHAGGPEGRLEHFGSVEDEYRALREASGLHARDGRGTLRLTGSDRVDFLHGMTTNHIRKLPAGCGCAAAFLTPKGKLVANARVSRRPDDLLVDTDADRLAPLVEVLDHHLISEDVELHDVSAGGVWFSLVGPRAAEALQAMGDGPSTALDEYQHVDVGGVLVVGTRTAGEVGFDFLVPAEKAAAWASAALERGVAAGMRPVGSAAMEIVRVESGEPRFGQDMGEETLPLEARLEKAISYDKGCYIGQEVIARASFRGAVRRRLTGLVFEGEELVVAHSPLLEAVGAPKPAGEVTSVVRSPAFGVIGLGYVRREHLTAPGAVLVTPDGRKVRLREPPFAGNG